MAISFGFSKKEETPVYLCDTCMRYCPNKYGNYRCTADNTFNTNKKTNCFHHHDKNNNFRELIILIKAITYNQEPNSYKEIIMPGYIYNRNVKGSDSDAINDMNSSKELIEQIKSVLKNVPFEFVIFAEKYDNDSSWMIVNFADVKFATNKLKEIVADLNSKKV